MKNSNWKLSKEGFNVRLRKLCAYLMTWTICKLWISGRGRKYFILEKSPSLAVKTSMDPKWARRETPLVEIVNREAQSTCSFSTTPDKMRSFCTGIWTKPRSRKDRDLLSPKRLILRISEGLIKFWDNLLASVGRITIRACSVIRSEKSRKVEFLVMKVFSDAIREGVTRDNPSLAENSHSSTKDWWNRERLKDIDLIRLFGSTAKLALMLILVKPKADKVSKSSKNPSARKKAYRHLLIRLGKSRRVFIRRRDLATKKST